MTVFSRSDFNCDYDLGPCPDWAAATEIDTDWTATARPSGHWVTEQAPANAWAPVPGPCDC